MTIRWAREVEPVLRWLGELAESTMNPSARPPMSARTSTTAPPVGVTRLRRVTLTDEVSRTLFGEYAAHRRTDRGAEETGWVLLGRRAADEAVVLATLPAGANRDAGEAHVAFNGEAQALASRIVRQEDRGLRMLGVVHTHPGRLRHPSRGDLDGDAVWVKNQWSGDGVFGIGTVDPDPPAAQTEVSRQPRDHVQTFGGLRFDWYTLGAGDRQYTPVPIEIAIGPDLAGPLRGVWGAVEEHAARLNHLAAQLARVRFVIGAGAAGPVLQVAIELDGGRFVRVLLDGKAVRFYYEAGGAVSQPDLPAGTAPDQGVYLLLAELAARP